MQTGFANSYIPRPIQYTHTAREICALTDEEVRAFSPKNKWEGLLKHFSRSPLAAPTLEQLVDLCAQAGPGRGSGGGGGGGRGDGGADWPRWWLR